MATIQDIVTREKPLVSGHRMCAGCGIPPIINTIVAASDKPVVIANATGCLEVTSTIYPFSAWSVPWIHLTFENAAAVASGIESALKALKKKGRINDDVNILAVGGDGGTYDIGFQALSGALERGHKFMYVVYDNQGYMNTATSEAVQHLLARAQQLFQQDQRVLVSHSGGRISLKLLPLTGFLMQQRQLFTICWTSIIKQRKGLKLMVQRFWLFSSHALQTGIMILLLLSSIHGLRLKQTSGPYTKLKTAKLKLIINLRKESQ